MDYEHKLLLKEEIHKCHYCKNYIENQQIRIISFNKIFYFHSDCLRVKKWLFNHCMEGSKIDNKNMRSMICLL